MKVSAIMTSRASVEATDDLSAAAQIPCGLRPFVEGRDARPRAGSPCVSDVATCVDRVSAGAGRAAERLADPGAFPVLDAARRPGGIVSYVDVPHHFGSGRARAPGRREVPRDEATRH